MNHYDNTGNDPNETPEVAALRQELQSLSRPRAATDFRADLKRSFRVGGIEPAFADEEVAATVPNSEIPTAVQDAPFGDVREPIPISPLRARRFVPWFAAVAVAAAAVFLAVFLNPGTASEWTVVAAQETGQLIVEGTSYDLAAGVSSLPRLLPGERVVYEGEGSVELLAPGFCAIELASGTSLQLPLRSEEAMYCQIDRGTARFVTGPDFAGNVLWVSAADTEVQVTGTTFSVLSSAERTCVSVFEGKVSVRAADGSIMPVLAGNCRTVFLDSRPPLDHGLNESQTTTLTALYERGSDYFDR